MKKWHELVATCVYIGNSKWAPGTLGSAAGLILLLDRSTVLLHSILVILIFFLGGYAAQKFIDSKRVSDPREVVIDEVCGIYLSFLAVPLHWKSIIAGFLLFRLFDIWKPFPIRKLEKLPSPWGVMVDDVGAGIYANLLLQVFFRLLKW